MTRNILSAIQTIIEKDTTTIEHNQQSSGNRIQWVGAGLETYLKDAFSDSFGVGENIKRRKYEENFSYEGSANHPPDFMLLGGDAVEVKKKNSAGGTIPLNSSYPKQRLYSKSPMITEACRNVENGRWDVKDLLYAIGHVKDETLLTLWLVYGDCYAAKPEIYESLANNIRQSVIESGLELGQTNELARVNRVDPLGKTSLRVRGMWQIEHPSKFFSYISEFEQNKRANFTLNAIMTKSKYDAFPENDRQLLEALVGQDLKIFEEEIQSPDNPEKHIVATIIRYSI